VSGSGDQADGFGGLFESAQQALSAQAEAATQVVEGSAGGGVVTVTMTGQGEVTSVTLSPAVVDPDDIEMLQDLIVAALRDAGLQVTELQRQAMGAFGSVDLGSLGDMLGGLMGGAGSDIEAEDGDAADLEDDEHTDEHDAGEDADADYDADAGEDADVARDEDEDADTARGEGDGRPGDRSADGGR
jgi:DNA-binding YbaB/EbfC family protein